MAIVNKKKRTIPPTHPGEMLREDFLPDYGLTTTSLATALGVSRQTVNELVRERRSVSPIMALKLARLFGNSPEFWMKAQHARDLWDSEQQFEEELARIEPLRKAGHQNGLASLAGGWEGSDDLKHRIEKSPRAKARKLADS